MKPHPVLRAVDWFLIVLLGTMIVLVFGNVVLRYLFNSGITVSEEVSRFIFMWVTLIGALLVMKDNAHLGMSSVVDRLAEKGKRVCRFLSDIVAMVCCGLLAHGTWKQVVLGMDDRSPVAGIPLGLVYLCLLISSVGMAGVLMYSLWRQLTGRMPVQELTPHADNAVD
ncbi:MAG: Tripartite ATP-independent periplasmic transporter, DctQ component [Polaromonas sp.]|jgi:TRAP-type C4-dicarboxylate transport system permease small subunit|nr:Tripartite ATP-independent periplasmic transporter, DctQ component [Polaromonas sp.]